ncbi:hypothetical protein HanRHA438_Chr08g0333111 [Helianthus annuus]|nr:hypothetical protein HanRHA438_Chr08g0333111 [Helianthus annuus]
MDSPFQTSSCFISLTSDLIKNPTPHQEPNTFTITSTHLFLPAGSHPHRRPPSLHLQHLFFLIVIFVGGAYLNWHLPVFNFQLDFSNQRKNNLVIHCLF